jgi:hypothetical protein
MRQQKCGLAVELLACSFHGADRGVAQPFEAARR